MTTVAIVAENDAVGTRFRAIAGRQQCVADTPGAALDAITAELPDSETGTILVVQQFRPDGLFTVSQRQRLGELMDRWRVARDAATALSEAEQTELEALINAEVRAAAARAADLLREPPQ